jgi:hypothetical protein
VLDAIIAYMSKASVVGVRARVKKMLKIGDELLKHNRYGVGVGAGVGGGIGVGLSFSYLYFVWICYCGPLWSMSLVAQSRTCTHLDRGDVYSHSCNE